MSAESPRRGIQKGAQVISPQPVSDRSIIESVAGIINDIVPQAYTGTPNVDNKESITWARFEYADVNDPALYPDYNEGSSTPPLLLVLGYSTGVQAWMVTASGEATEVLSWRQGVVRTLRFLPNPKASNEQIDIFQSKRPMVALCDSAGPGPQFCSIGFISLSTGEQVKSIKFKNPVNDVLANRRSVVVTFSEKIAVFDAKNLEGILTVTTCYLSPGPNSNPVALGTRWLAYSEKKLIPARRSSGGSEGEGAQSYTATVLHAAKSLGKGLRGLGETVASTLTGNTTTPQIPNNIGFDTTQPGVVTILDLQAAKEDKESDDGTVETVLAHFMAHSDAIVAMTFDLTGALLMTADRRGHDFHIFRIQTHPGGPTLAAVHHLYVLHRGDTTAKVQDMTFSSDARWAAVSTVRGTTHVFPVAPYGGSVGVRTHSTPHVVNRLSRFHRSAGLTADGTRSHSPVAHAEIPVTVYPYSNPRLPPYPHPIIIHPLAQIRQPSTLGHLNNQPQPRPQQRQRLSSEDSGSLPLKICSCFAPQRAWLYAQRDTTNKVIKRPVDSLFIMACHGNMIQYDLEPKPAAGVPKEKICDDTTIELDVEAKGQWPLLRSANSLEILPPLPASSPLLGISIVPKGKPAVDSSEDQWLSQVEIVTHAGPHRRLWMGPQFIFKTYNAPSGVAVNLVEAEAVEIGVTGGSRPARSNPVNMPHAAARPLVPVVIDGSGSSYEQSPRFLEAYGDSLENETVGVGGGENQLREDLAEAMLETAAAPHRVPGRRVVVERMGQPVAKVVNPLGTVITVSADEEDVVSSDSYEMDDNLEPLRSLCAEEGPASLDDFRQESQPVKNSTEICAEMRTTSEPAIDSLASKDIKEVVEKKEFYAEAARLRSKGTIDFDEAEAFTDVQMTLNLCAEAGKIPTSPMTQARDNPWNQKTTSVERKLQEAKIARAKYVVNYDEETIIFTDNRETVNEVTNTGEPVQNMNFPNHSRVVSGGVRKEQKHPVSHDPTEREKDLKRANISDTADSSFEQISGRDRKGSEHEKLNEIHTGGNKVGAVKSLLQADITAAAPRVVKQTPTTSVVKEKSGKKKIKKQGKEVEKIDSSFETIKDSEINAITSQDLDPRYKNEFDRNSESKVFERQTDASDEIDEKSSPQQRQRHIDDVVSEYLILEKNEVFDGHSISSNHSDEDLEHIHTSEVTTVLASQETIDESHSIVKEHSSDEIATAQCNDSKICRGRKPSKTTSSDDDMEHIQSSEIPEDYSRVAQPKHRPNAVEIQSGAEYSKRKNLQKTASRISTSPERNTEDGKYRAGNSVAMQVVRPKMPEVVNESKVEEQAIPLSDPAGCSTVDQGCSRGVSKSLEASVNPMRGEQVAEFNVDTTKGKHKTKPNKNRKKKDDVLVVVVSGTTEENEVTVRNAEGVYAWNKKNKTPENDLAEEIDKCVDLVPGESAISCRFVHKDGKIVSNEAASLDNIEIIDIDALRRAEAECENDPNSACAVECRVEESRPEILLSRPKKSKRSKKVTHIDAAKDSLRNLSPLSLSKLKLLETEIHQREPCKNSDVIESESQIPVSSWSSIVKKSKDQCSMESCDRAIIDENEIDLKAEVVQAIESTPVSLSICLEDETEKEDQTEMKVPNNDKDINEECVDSNWPAGKFKKLKSDRESEEALQLLCTDSRSISETEISENLDVTLRDIKGTTIKENTKDDDVENTVDSDTSFSPLYSSKHDNNALGNECEGQSSDSEHDPQENSTQQQFNSVASAEEDVSRVIGKSESAVPVVSTVDLSSSSARSSKEPSPEVEPLPMKGDDLAQGAAVGEPSNVVDELIPNVNLMDTEEDNSSKENIEKCLGNGSSSAKNRKSKKKRRR